ncbi:MAG: hypothetical protein BroJett041_23520 [Candidatus Jettenia caeni]|nr:MAG: hypothetical protein BroJett041_23520 [Candidatus Jettenia caeni]
MSIFSSFETSYLNEIWMNSELSLIDKYKILFFGSIMYLKIFLYLGPFVIFIYLLKQGRDIRRLINTELEKQKNKT